MLQEARRLENSHIRYARYNTNKTAQTTTRNIKNKQKNYEGCHSMNASPHTGPLIPYLVFFNKIFDTGIYPSAWCKCIIVPIHKKGVISYPSNYREITLVNVLAQIFSLILRNRLNIWWEEQKVFNDSQFGFRDNRSTTECVFLLHSIIQNIVNGKLKLYCVFIDYEKAFDTIVRDALWLKLLKVGISCKMLTVSCMLQSIYASVTSCVKLSSSMPLSDFFDVTLGLKQGEPLLPISFLSFL
jgi:hypothetical protein